MDKRADSFRRTCFLLAFVLLTLLGWPALCGAIVSYPFEENFEVDLNDWAVTGSWAIVTDGATKVITDSPGGNYGADQTSHAMVTIDLRLAESPVLTFLHKYWLADDLGEVAISTDGTTWTTVWDTTATEASWSLERVDLGDYAGMAQVQNS